jgi:ribonuclease HII
MMKISDRTVTEIKIMLDAVSETDRSELLLSMERDPRVQVRKLAKSKRSAIKRKQRDDAVLAELLRYERKLYKQGFDLVAGVDEAGRGALAGPLVAAAAILPKDNKICGLRDSKQLTPEKRDALYDVIIETAIAWNIVSIDNSDIDIRGIQWANLQGLRQAVCGLRPSADYILSDAFSLSAIDTPSMALIKGDAKSLSIAAASVLAKVSRDRIMLDFHKLFPQYEFDRHKGYGTAVHIEKIAQYGVSPLHRISFSPCSKSEQLSLDIFPAYNSNGRTARQLQ